MIDLLAVKRMQYSKYAQHLVLRGEAKSFASAKRIAIKNEFLVRDRWVPFGIKAKQSATKIKPEGEFNHTQRACYHNALAYVKMHPEVQLAVGVVYFTSTPKMVKAYKPSKTSLKNRPSDGIYVEHAFCVKDGNIVDPTIEDEDGDTYFYQIIPPEVWKKFPFQKAKAFGAGFTAVENYWKTLRETALEDFDVNRLFVGGTP
jgi:hypothetical protein